MSKHAIGSLSKEVNIELGKGPKKRGESMVFYHTRGQGSKNLKGGTGNNFDCLSGTEKKVGKLRHFAKKSHRWRYFYNNKKARKSKHFAKTNA